MRPYARNGSETVALWHKVSTVEDPDWTRRYHSRDPKEKAFGGRVVVTLNDGATIEDEIAVADAHPLGARPFARPQYIAKFRTLAEGIIAPAEQDRFLGLVERLPKLKADDLGGLTFTVDPSMLVVTRAAGIFDWRAAANGATHGLSVVSG